MPRNAVHSALLYSAQQHPKLIENGIYPALSKTGNRKIIMYTVIISLFRMRNIISELNAIFLVENWKTNVRVIRRKRA
jgi:hypothetical protein